MEALLEVMAPEYAGRVNIFTLKDRDNWEAFLKYRIMVVPTEILFDAEGNQVTTHIGTWSREEIEAQFEKLGVK